jgi:nucleoside-diphosphate-sugar epimerase
MTSTVLILGARGRFGAAAARAFAAAGWRVLAQRRRAGPEAAGSGVQWLDVAREDAAQAARAAGGADVVVHALNPAYDSDAWRSQAPGLMAQAIATAQRLGAVVLFPGNVYNFGAGMPARLTEDTPMQPTSTKGQVRVQIEQQLAQAARGGLASVVIRAGDFFGCGGETYFDRVIAPNLSRGRMGYPGDRTTPTAWAYLPDLADTFVAVAERRAQWRGAQVFHFSGHTLRGQDWLDALQPLAEARGWVRTGQALRLSPLPWSLIRLGGLFVKPWASMAEMRYLWRTPHALDSGRLRAFIGAEPHTPLPVALARSLLLTPLGRPGSVPLPA